MTVKEKKIIQKTPAKEIMRMYISLVDDIRSGKLSATCGLYNIGWNDGYNVGRRSKRGL